MSILDEIFETNYIVLTSKETGLEVAEIDTDEGLAEYELDPKLLIRQIVFNQRKPGDIYLFSTRRKPVKPTVEKAPDILICARHTRDGYATIFPYTNKACVALGLKQSHVTECLRKTRKSHKGFTFTYVSEETSLATFEL